MTSVLYNDWVTLEVGGEELDFEVRGRVDLEMTSRGMIAVLDGSPEVKVHGRWRYLDDLDVSAQDRESVFTALEECALEDDSDQCADEDRDDRWEEAS